MNDEQQKAFDKLYSDSRLSFGKEVFVEALCRLCGRRARKSGAIESLYSQLTEELVKEGWRGRDHEELPPAVRAMAAVSVAVLCPDCDVKHFPKITPKFKEVHYLEMDYNDFNDLVSQVYGGRYDYFTVEEDSRDYVIDGKPLSRWESGRLEEFKADPENLCTWPTAHILLEDMVARGILPKGTYLIKVS